jgi:hypothetical protein
MAAACSGICSLPLLVFSNSLAALLLELLEETRAM